MLLIFYSKAIVVICLVFSHILFKIRTFRRMSCIQDWIQYFHSLMELLFPKHEWTNSRYSLSDWIDPPPTNGNGTDLNNINILPAKSSQENYIFLYYTCAFINVLSYILSFRLLWMKWMNERMNLCIHNIISL